MKFLGRGWQYSVYDLGNGRVLKRYNTKREAYSVMLKENFPYIEYPIWKFPTYYQGCRDTALGSIEKIRKTQIDLKHFGNPKILNELDYEQDTVVPLHAYLPRISFEAGKQLIDDFVEFNIMLLKQKLIDKSFLIGKNYGIDSNGNIILIDIGELYSSDESIKKQILKKPWDCPYVTSTIPKSLRSYFVEEMNRNFTVE